LLSIQASSLIDDYLTGNGMIVIYEKCDTTDDKGPIR
jgi:hypothetical protein